MSSIAESFTTWLEANATITATLASAASIYPNRMPQSHDGFPALTYRLSGDDDQQMMDGGVNELKLANIEISVWDKSFETVNDIATTLKSELVGFRGAFGAHTAEHIMKENEFSSDTEEDTQLNRIVLEFRIAYF